MKKLKLILTVSAVVIAVAAAFTFRENSQAAPKPQHTDTTAQTPVTPRTTR